MRKIANTVELQAELSHLLDYAQSHQPSRVVLAQALSDLSERVAATPKTVFLEQDRWNYAYRLEGVSRGVPNNQLLEDFKKDAKTEWISAKVRKGKNATTEIKRWVKSVNPREFFVKWPSNVDDDSIKVFYKP